MIFADKFIINILLKSHINSFFEFLQNAYSYIHFNKIPHKFDQINKKRYHLIDFMIKCRNQFTEQFNCFFAVIFISGFSERMKL